jgi:EF hand
MFIADIKPTGLSAKVHALAAQDGHCPYIFIALAVVLTSLACSQASAQGAAQAPSSAVDTPTEIISGQSRFSAPRARRAPIMAEHLRSEPAPFLNPLPPLPKGPYYGKIKRPRKHRLDQDRDGFVSKQELELENQTRSAAFREADQNQDGKLDASEMRRYQALVQPRGRGRH